MFIDAVSLTERTEIADLKTRKIECPTPGDRQVLLKMIAGGINPMDWESASGPHAWIDSFPHTLGNEGAGEIVALGKEVKGYQVGDVVVAYHFGDSPGMFAEYNLVDAGEVALLPPGFSPLDWAASPIALLSVYHAFYKRGLPPPGTSILIEGTGGVGVFAIQWAQKLGFAVSVLATERSQSWAQELGASRVFSAGKSEANLDEELKSAQASGFDLIFSTLGKTAIPRLAGHLAKNGRFISTMPIQSPAGQELADYGKVSALSMDAVFKQNSWEWFLAEPDRQLMTQMLGEADRLGIRCPVAQRYPLAQVSEALARASAGGNRGKIVLTMGPVGSSISHKI